jgi:hypothetical protein
MKTVAIPKLDTTSLLSNLLLLCTVVMAIAPIVLGDRLVLIVSAVFTQGGLLLQDFSAYLQRLVS